MNDNDKKESLDSENYFLIWVVNSNLGLNIIFA